MDFIYCILFALIIKSLDAENFIATTGVSDEFSADVDADADENVYADAETDADKFVDNNYKWVLSDDFSAGEEE